VAAVFADRRTLMARAATLALALGIWFWPVPEGLTGPAWRLFGLFVATIFAVIAGALPILTAWDPSSSCT
jgi:DASS family divalent anion:Na+ symporter